MADLNALLQRLAGSLHYEAFSAISLGRFASISPVFIQGHNPDVDTTTTPADIWESGGLYAWPTTAEQLSIVSGSANDAVAGTGARTVRITGLDANYDVITEDVTLAGLTPVNTVQSFLRVNDFRALTAGSGGLNAGVITASRTGPVSVSVIGAADGVAHQAIYTVPRLKRFVVQSVRVGTLGINASGIVYLYSRSLPGGAWVATTLVGTFSAGSSIAEAFEPHAVHRVIQGPADLRGTVISVASNNDAYTLRAHGMLVNDDA